MKSFLKIMSKVDVRKDFRPGVADDSGRCCQWVWDLVMGFSMKKDSRAIDSGFWCGRKTVGIIANEFGWLKSGEGFRPLEEGCWEKSFRPSERIVDIVADEFRWLKFGVERLGVAIKVRELGVCGKVRTATAALPKQEQEEKEDKEEEDKIRNLGLRELVNGGDFGIAMIIHRISVRVLLGFNKN
ncbi:unnamed protein product [Dovyalis caffra]|uniref:Uncharacterized protein n=1 Tax=Dovyalis caffra TaxID=77055 RepID=A0AAV1S663_9ROSI|nr:unnamed protein product [Dovyalis caffra]